MATLLRQFGIVSKQHRFGQIDGERQLRGYRRDQFKDSWDRYLPDSTRHTRNSDAETPVHRGGDVEDSPATLPMKVAAVTGRPLPLGESIDSKVTGVTAQGPRDGDEPSSGYHRGQYDPLDEDEVEI